MKTNHPHLQFKEEIPLRPCTYYVVVHHTAKEHYTIQQWHKEHSKKIDWLGFGYHYFIDQNTCEIYEGRQRNEEGSHVKHYNDCSIGVCFDGDFDKNKIKDAQLRASVELIASLQLIYAAPLLRHKDFPGVQKSCPGDNFPFDEELKALVDEKKYELLKEILKLPVATCDGLSFKESLERRNRTEYVTIHHAKAYGTIKEVHQWWIKSGKAGVPYHYYIDKNGKVFEGRPRDTKGALATMINSCAVGIGLEGDFDKNPVNSKQWDSCVKLAALLEMLYGAKSHRHSDFSETTSPGKNFAFDAFRHEVRELKAAAVSALSKRLDGGTPVRQMPPLTFIPKSEYDAAANHPNKYIPLLKGKKVGVVCNHTSMVENVHLVDFLRSKSIDVVKIFAPEHGFRGDADAGACVNDGKDSRTGLPVISLFKNGTIKPSAETLKDVDVILFDIQDVGVRFYTYLTNLTDMMESAAENGKPFILLDRPNPNGFYVDGPVLQPEYVSSFVGRTPIPIVYGLTIGEYATMVNKEGWLKNKDHCNLTVVWMEHYNRHAIYELPVKPSPNLPDWQSVYLYPSLCLFEGTIVSVGRGTSHPFHCYGHPEMRGAYSFVPTSMPGARNPLHKNECCRGESLVGFANDFKIVEKRLHLEWLRDAYLQLKHKDFFTSYFLKLAGTPELQEDIMADKTIEEIQFSWQQGIHEFMKIRSKYLHY